MSATPVVNNLREAVKVLESLLPGQDFSKVPVGASIANAVRVHLLLRRHGIRHVPRYPLTLEVRTPELDGSDLLPRLIGIPPGEVLRLEQIVLETKLKELHRWLCRGTMIYTYYVKDIVEPLTEAVEGAGFRVRHFTGKSRVEIRQFIDDYRAGRADVLIGSAAVGTGVDRLQYVLNRLLFITLPWSGAEYQQVIGRLYRQGAVAGKVEVIIPQVVLREEKAGLWSWDDLRLRCIEYKRTLADAAVDSVIPAGGLPSREELQRRSLTALHAWAARVEKGASQDGTGLEGGRLPSDP